MGEDAERKGVLMSNLPSLTGYQDNLIKRHLLWRLYHLAEEINSHAQEIEDANVKLADLRDQVVS